MGIQSDLTDLAELKRLAEAASVESPGAPWAYEPHGDTGEYGVGVLVNEQGNYVEGRQGSCEMSVVVPVAPEVSSEVFAAFIVAANPSAVLALIAENERLGKLLGRMVNQSIPLVELEGVPGWSRVIELVEVAAERDQLKAENEALRKDAERYRWLRNRLIGAYSDWDDSGKGMLGLAFKVPGERWIGCDESIDAAMRKGARS